MYFCYPLRKDFVEIYLVYEASSVFQWTAISFCIFPAVGNKNQHLITCCTCFCHLQSHKKIHYEVIKV